MLGFGQIPIFGILGLRIAANVERGKMRSETDAIANIIVRAYRLEQQLGKWYHVVYLNGWTRREDVAGQTVLIVKPEKNERIYLDLALQTYYKATANDATTSSASTRAMLCAPSTTVDRGPEVLDGVTTEIYETTFDSGNTSVTMTRYESSYTEPPKRDWAGTLVPFDCPAQTVHTGPPMPLDRVSLYSTIVTRSGAQSVTRFDEVGNVKQGEVDRALFEIPSVFREKRPFGLLGLPQ
jgi:hypothetical protein